MKTGLVYMPYKILVTKTIICDKDGTRSYWQINKWKRFKLFIHGLFHKKKSIW